MARREILHIPQISWTRASPSDAFVSYTGHSLWGGGSHSSIEMQSMYTAAPANRAGTISIA